MSDSGNNAPPGWYPDGQGGQRWWDGTRWGPEGQPPLVPAAPPAADSQDASPSTMAMPTSPPPQYAPPGQEPSGAGASGRNTKMLLGIIGGLVGVAVLVVILVLALGGGNGPSSDDPAETVSAFFDAARDGDCDTAFDLLTDNAKSTMGASKDDCAAADPSGDFGKDVSIDVGDAKVDGDDATVPVSLSAGPGGLSDLGLGEFSIDLALKKEGGAWLIDDFGFGSLLENLPDLPDLPDDPFSDLPTDLLSDFPTDLLSDFPTE